MSETNEVPVFESIGLMDLKPAEYNPRVMSNEDFNKLSKSINEFGLVDPIIVNLNNMTIIGGHQRYDVLLSEYKENRADIKLVLLRRGDIGWVFTDEDLTIKSIEHEKGLNIALNRISGEWDYEKLNSLLADLSDMNFELSLTGFDNLDLNNLEDLDDIDLGEENPLKEETQTPTVEDLTPKLIIMFDEEEEKEELYEELVERGYRVQY